MRILVCDIEFDHGIKRNSSNIGCASENFDAIEKLIMEPELREKMGRRARKMVEETFAVELATRLIIEQYNHILGS